MIYALRPCPRPGRAGQHAGGRWVRGVLMVTGDACPRRQGWEIVEGLVSAGALRPVCAARDEIFAALLGNAHRTL